MYKINEINIFAEDGTSISSYGIESEEISFKDLSFNKNKVEKLCFLCNKYKIKESQLKYIIEDFLKF